LDAILINLEILIYEGHTKVPLQFYMIAELFTVVPFVVTTIKKGLRPALRGAATGAVTAAGLLVAEKATEFGIRKLRRHGKKRI